MYHNIVSLGKGADGIFIENHRFNTTLVSFHFFLPLSAENLAADALLPYLLTSCSKDFPSYTQLNKKLFSLYGAELSCQAAKRGDNLHLRISIVVINDKFTLDGTSIVKKATDLLTSLIFNPSVKNEAFLEEDLKREKRKTIERIEGEINDKRSFAKTRLLNEMFSPDPYGTFTYGTVEEVSKLDSKTMYSAWQRLLKNSYIRVNVVGEKLPEGLFERLEEKFGDIERTNITDPEKTTPLKERQEPKTVEEHYNVTQGKLSMGFSSEVYGQGVKTFPLLLATDIFGGGPYSKLFTNVREKQSLCYYCSASSVRQKGFMVVSSGIDDKNADKVIKAVLKELSAVQKGDFEDFALNASKKSITDSLNAYYDSSVALDAWYGTNLSKEEILTPKAAIEAINKISKEEIINAAKGLKLHTIYKLLSQEGNS